MPGLSANLGQVPFLLAGGEQLAETKERKEQEFFAQMPDPQTSQAVRRLMEVAEENHGVVSWARVGFSIRSRRKDFAGWSRQVSVAWIYPPGVETWMTCKDFSFGAGAGEKELFEGVPDYLRVFLEKLGLFLCQVALRR